MCGAIVHLFNFVGVGDLGVYMDKATSFNCFLIIKLFYILSSQVESLDLTQKRNVFLIVRYSCLIFFFNMGRFY